MRRTIPVWATEGLPFERIGNYRLIDKLGEGGMGEVYLGVEEPVGRKVAIKLMRAGLDKWGLQRFNDERKALASLNQRNIVVMLTSGEAYHRPYLVMEYLEGESLGERLLRGPISPPEVAEITRQVCDALNAAHRREIVHRDIKPANIFLTSDDDGRLVKVLDFGIATLKESETQTTSGAVIGSGPYLSPEQSRGLSRREIDGRADIYALGMVVYEMLTGVRAFTAQDFTGYQYLHLYVMPPPPSERMPGTGSEAIDQVVMKALAKDPSHRHQTAREFARELQAAVERGYAPAPWQRPEHGRVQVPNALVEGRTGSKPSEIVVGSLVPAATPGAKPITVGARGWRPLYISLLALSLLFLLGVEGWWIYARFISPSLPTLAGDSSRGGLGSQPANPSATGGAGDQNPSPERTAAPETGSPAGGPTPFKPATTAGGAVEIAQVTGGTNARSSTASPQMERPVADAFNASRLIGRWRADVVEYGIQTRIIWQVNRDGTTNYQFVSSYGSTSGAGKWRLSDGTLYEQFRDGRAAGKIRWIDDNHLELTILYNQNPRSKGLIRRYSRIF